MIMTIKCHVEDLSKNHVRIGVFKLLISVHPYFSEDLESFQILVMK
jgi:hypothetical protein